MENVKNPFTPPKNAVDNPLQEILRNNLLGGNRVFAVKQSRNAGAPLNSPEEYAILTSYENWVIMP